MEALRQDDPRRFGRFTALARFDEQASAVRYVARDAASGETALVTAARPELAAVPVFSRRFRAEARTAERLAGGWVSPPLETGKAAGTSGDGPEPLWTAAGYVPALPLDEAVGIAGPLPERVVRVLGAGIAETLSRVHATGAALQGLAPGTVLLAADGPRLTAFGPLGAAASAEAGPEDRLSVRLGYLTPEQIAGEEVSAASDLFVLGLLLAYAATGATPFTEGPAEGASRRIAEDEPELDGVPQELRELIASCLAKDPAERPSAGTVAAELALEGAAGLARGGWLPEPLAAAVADQEARVRALEAPAAGGAETPGTDGAPGTDGTPSADGAPCADRTPGTDGAPGAAGTFDAEEAPGAETAGPGGIEEDRGTTRFLNTGPRPPRNDTPTTQLALPQGAAAPPPPALAPTAQQAPAAPGASAAPGTPAAHSAPAASGGAPQPGHPYAAPAAPYAAPGSVPPHSGPTPYPAAALPTGAGGAGAGGGGPMVSLPLPPAPAPAPDPGASRRTLLTIAAAAVGGLVVGGGAMAALGSGETAAATDDKPAPKPRRTLPGQAPEPRWTYTYPASEAPPLTAAVWQDELLVLTGESQAAAIDLRTGKRRWQRADAAKGQAALAAGTDLVFVASPTEFLWLAPKDGKVVHRVRHTEAFDDLAVGPLAGSSGPVIWFTASHTVTVKAPKPKKGKKKGKDKQVPEAFFLAYDIVRRKELWRTPVPAGRAPGTPSYRVAAERSVDILVRQRSASLTPAEVRAAKRKGSVRSFDQKTGKLLWTKQYGAATPEAATAGDEDGTLYAAVGTDLEAFEADTAKPLWRVEGTEGSVYGTPLIAGPLVHTTESSQSVGAVDRESGRLVWRRSTEVPAPGNAPAITLSSSEKTLIAADAVQVTAFAADSGERLWKFQDIGAAEPKGATVSAPYRVLTVGKTAIVQRERSFYAFPVA
ncbi:MULTISPECIES: PQQ-binding-like beta-propeller repeat protein [Streptomyces]|uniref:outer membrane protein assembly factor BamB family protein n=1 Tax=Streptomyces TaxID=1883 RepID=UPI0004BD73FE|nr:MULTISPECIES: PQQ-binding-like beta-propeller repeat protein [Streptomyces]KOG81767.1 serine/threonine protein kinase [Streptomyces griseus subsp. rhodochrous]